MSKFCPVLNDHEPCNECLQVEKNWHIDKLLNDLAYHKGKPLSKKEECLLFLLLYGYSPNEIFQRFKYEKGYRSIISKTIYTYVKALTDKNEIKDWNWAHVRLYLDNHGYRKQYSDESIEIRIKIPVSLDHQLIGQAVSELQKICEVTLVRTEGT